MILLLIFFKGSVISLAWDSPSKQKIFFYFMWISFGQKFTRKAKNGSECWELIWSGTFAICSTQPLWLWSKIVSRVELSHYIQPIVISLVPYNKLASSAQQVWVCSRRTPVDNFAYDQDVCVLKYILETVSWECDLWLWSSNQHRQ